MPGQKKQKPVGKPFLHGRVIDRSTPGAALRFFAMMLLATMLFMLAASIFVSEVVWLKWIIFMISYGLLYYSCFAYGSGNGAAAVDLGEKYYLRHERGNDVTDKEAARAYHPLKGFVNALIGSVPMLICAILLAVTARLQVTGLGELPSWVKPYEATPQFGDALAYYHAVSPFSLESIVRIPVRMFLMPVIGIIGADNHPALLVMERLSPLLVLVCPLVYGLGYTRGIQIRAQVHADIEKGNRKRARKEKRKVEARRQAAKNGPQQLN